MTFPEWYLRSRAHLHLGLSPWPYGLNIKCITALYLESHMPFLGSSPNSPSDFGGRTVQTGVSVPVISIHYLLGFDGGVKTSQEGQVPLQ